MDARREQRQRGTKDFPFSCYNFNFAVPCQMSSPTHWHPEQEILYVKKGSIEVLVGKNTYLVGEREICFVPPNALHSVMISEADTMYYALVFSYDILCLPDSHFFQIGVTEPMREGRLAFPTVLDRNAPCFPVAMELLDRMCTCDQTTPNYKLTVFQALVCLYVTLEHTLVSISNVDNITDNKAVKSCLDYMQAHYREKITLEQLGQLVHLHPNYLCKLFKVYTGQSAFQQLIRIRLEKATQLLEKNACPVSQVAELCGFESVSFFSRKFKQIIGCAPKDYHNHDVKKVY